MDWIHQTKKTRNRSLYAETEEQHIKLAWELIAVLNKSISINLY
jgi:hypothetical protein